MKIQELTFRCNRSKILILLLIVISFIFVSTLSCYTFDLALAQQLVEQSRYNSEMSKLLDQMNSPLNKTLPQILSNSNPSVILGTEPENKNNWIMTNHDLYGTRTSNQTTIGRDNVNKLQVKWIFNEQVPIESSPIVVGNRVYIQDNTATIFAFDTGTGLNLWKTKTGNGGGSMHGLTYNNGIIFAGSGSDARVVAVNSTNGKIIWKSSRLGQSESGYAVIAPPIVWKNYIIAGSAGGDNPPNKGEVQGNITAINRTNGQVLWNFKTTTGMWVGSDKSPPNGGATTWTGGSLDPVTGLLYDPAGNASPDFNATTRLGSQLYANHMLAINITNGKLAWDTPFIAQGTILKNVKVPDTHDYDTSWGSTISIVKLDNGTQKKIVIGTDKRGDIIAMDAANGKPIWWRVVGTVYRDTVDPSINGSGLVFPGSSEGIQAYHAVDDNNTAYFATSSNGYNFFINGTDSAFLEPVINATKSAIGNGTITSIDVRSGNIKWQTPTQFPTRVSPLVTNGLVISGHMTSVGKPYTADTFGAPMESPILSSGIVIALDKKTGNILWQFNVGSEISIGGPSVGNGMLFVPTGKSGGHTGSLVAFGLPN